MMAEIDDAQTEILATYQSLTGDENTPRSIRVLRANNWNLNDAVNASIAPYASNTPPPPPILQANNLQAQRRPVPLLFWPFTLLYRLIARPISFGTSIITGILRFGINFVGSLLPFQARARREDIDPATAAARFLQQFESTYGNRHPHFLAGTYSQAVERARTECKFLFVYLHCELNQNTQQFCGNTLCSEVLTDFVNNNFVAWAANIRHQQGFQVNNLLGATTYPFMAIVCCNPIPGVSTGNSVTIVDRVEGMITPADLIVRLTNVLDTFGQILTSNRVEREQRETDRQIRQEQDEAYLRSLAEDQEKERKMREEQQRQQEEQELAEEEERKRVEADNSRHRTREAKRAAMPAEPREGDKESVKLTVRVADGTRLTRRFHMNDTIQTVLDYVDISQEAPADNYVLVSNFPRQIYSNSKQTLKDALIYPHPVALFIQEK